MTEWWTTRSMAAIVVIGSLKIRSHSENTRLVVITTLLALVALGQQREQHLHLVAVVLHVADVVQDQAREAIELAPAPAAGADRAWPPAAAAPARCVVQTAPGGPARPARGRGRASEVALAGAGPADGHDVDRVGRGRLPRAGARPARGRAGGKRSSCSVRKVFSGGRPDWRSRRAMRRCRAGRTSARTSSYRNASWVSCLFGGIAAPVRERARHRGQVERAQQRQQLLARTQACWPSRGEQPVVDAQVEHRGAAPAPRAGLADAASSRTASKRRRAAAVQQQARAPARPRFGGAGRQVQQPHVLAVGLVGVGSRAGHRRRGGRRGSGTARRGSGSGRRRPACAPATRSRGGSRCGAARGQTAAAASAAGTVPR